MMATMPKVYLDTNVLIAAFERSGAHSDHAWWLLRAIEEGDMSAVTSEITLSEVLVKPLELGNGDLVSAYTEILTTGDVFEVPPVDRDVLIQAAHLRSQWRSLRLPDAVHAATAIATSCVAFISDDKRLPLPGGMPHLQVNPFTVDDIRSLLP